MEARIEIEVLESTGGDTGEINLWRTEEINHEKKCDCLFVVLVRVIIVPKFMVTHTHTKLISFFFQFCGS